MKQQPLDLHTLLNATYPDSSDFDNLTTADALRLECLGEYIVSLAYLQRVRLDRLKSSEAA